MNQKIVNLGLRGITIGIRFLFVFFIGKYISLDFLGVYSLWNTTITMALLLVGFDFYIYSIRNILKQNAENQFNLIQNHLAFILVSYLICAPILFLIFASGFLEMQLVFWFYLVLILEHFGMEMYRLFTALEKPIFSNFLLLLRTASWMLIFGVLWFFTISPDFGMKEILILWSISALFANIIAWVVLRKKYRDSAWSKTDWNYIYKGIRVSSQLFLATITLKIIEFSDRYMIDYYLGEKELGIFSFFFQLSNLINVVVYTIVIMIVYPKLYKAIFEGKEDRFKIRKDMISQTTVIWILLSIGVLVITPFIIELMDKPELDPKKSILYLMLPASLFFNLYFVFKTTLNAYHKDRILLYIGVIAAVLNLIINIVYIESIGIHAASISSLISYFVLAVGTFYFERKEIRKKSIE